MKPSALPLRHRLDAILAVGERRLDADEKHHLGKSDGDHREVNASAANGERSGDESEGGGGGDADRDRRNGFQAPHFGGVGADVAGEAEKHRVPKRQKVRVADQEIERAREQRETHRLHDEERIGEKGRDRDQGDHNREGDGADATILARHVRGGDGSLEVHVRPPAQTGRSAGSEGRSP